MFKKIKDFTITRKEKAVVGAVVSAVAAYLAESGLTVDDIFTSKGLWAFVIGVAVHLSVYFTPNSEEL